MSTLNSEAPSTQNPEAQIENGENQNSKIINPPLADSPFPPLSPQSSDLSPLLPPGCLTLLLGEPGAGKSLLALDLAARLSRGQPLPWQLSPQSSVLSTSTPSRSFIASSAEDPPEIVRSRLEAFHANTSLITTVPHHFSLIDHNTKRHQNRLDDHAESSIMNYLRTFTITERRDKLRLIILDPLPAFLEHYDCANQATVRRILQPILTLAANNNVAILGISHLNKSTGKSLLQHSIGSLAYTALARSVLLLTDDTSPSVPQSLRSSVPPLRRVLIPIKNNLAPITHAHPLEIHNSQPSVPSCLSASVPSIVWLPANADHPLLRTTLAPSPLDPIERSQLELAIHFLNTALAEGPIPSSQLLAEARQISLSTRTLARARTHLRVQVDFERPTRRWISSLPDPNLPEKEPF